MNYSPRVATEVRVEMVRQRVTVSQLSQATNIPPSRLHRRFNGSTSFDTDELEVIAGALNIAASELVRRAEEAGAA